MDLNELLNSVEAKNTKVNPVTNKNDKSFDNVMDSISKNWSGGNNTDELEMLKKQLKEAQKQVQILKFQNPEYSKNENKILNAIRTESLEQGTSEPQISSRVFRTTYKVSSDYFRKSIDALLAKEVIKRTEIKFAGKVPTYKWKIIGNKDQSNQDS